MLIKSFLTYIRCELNLSAHTVLSYQKDLEQWQEFATEGKLETFSPTDATTSDIRLWISYLASNGLSTTSILRKAQALRAFFRYLMKQHGLKHNPAAEITLARTEKTLPTYIRQEELSQLFNSEYDSDNFIETRDRLILLTFYSTGMRCSELLNLLDANIDTIKGELKVLGKRNKERIIPFGNELSEMIEQYRQLRNNEIGHASPQFFIREDGRPLYRKLIYNIVHNNLEGQVHSNKQSPHVLRHSFASDMLNNGANINAVQQLLGHESLATTQIYTHITYRELKHNYELAHPRALKKGGHYGNQN